jgi:asparagine synthase (glutamine-hydrolysing)
MCGIAGIFYRDTQKYVDQSLVKNITHTLHHRGPDDEGYYIKKNIGLGHKRLSIIDLETGHQPISNEEGSLWIIFNGEIYNYIELRSELLAKGHRFKTHSDTEVILHLYEEYDTECLNRLNGMFAFAIWDDKKKEVFCARDHFGIKPFYYYFDNEKFIFASEIKALLVHPDLKAKTAVNEPAIHEYITLQFCLGQHTLFKDIYKLLPGNYLRINKSAWSEKQHSYWQLNFKVDTHHTEDYYADKLLLLLEDSIRLQLRSDVPLGAHLSGGLDSSTVVCMAASLLGKSIKTFTGGFKESMDYDETPYAKLVSDYTGTEYFEIFPNAHDFIESLPKLIYAMDEPVAGPGLFPQYFVSKLASENVKVVLGGQGGDEIFGGYARYLVAYLEQCIKGAIFETQEEGEYVVTLESIIPNLNLLQNYRPMLQQFWKSGVFEPMDKRYFQLIDRSGDLNIYSQDFNFNKMTHFDMKTLLPALLQVEDRTSMAVSLESRVPLLDYRIVQLIASMPPTMKFKAGQAKHIFKESIQNVIPSEILNRKDKKGFPVPLTEWYKGPIKEFVLDHLSSPKFQQRGIYDSNKIKHLLDREEKFGRQIWGLLCLELWYESFIDK